MGQAWKAAFVSFANVPLAKTHQLSTPNHSGRWELSSRAGDAGEGKLSPGKSVAIFAARYTDPPLRFPDLTGGWHSGEVCSKCVDVNMGKSMGLNINMDETVKIGVVGSILGRIFSLPQVTVRSQWLLGAPGHLTDHRYSLP